MMDELQTKNLSHKLPSDVIGGGPEATGHDQNIGP